MVNKFTETRKVFTSPHPRSAYAKDYKGVYRLSSKIKDEGFEADLYTKR